MSLRPIRQNEFVNKEHDEFGEALKMGNLGI